MRRVVVVGTSGSGKTTLARQLAAQLNCPHVELDALYWLPGWDEAPDDLFRERALAALVGDCWTTDGNYSKVRDIVWGRADTVVWLDYSFPLVFWRIFKRTVWRGISRQELWGTGNRENLLRMFTRDSMLWWVIRTYRRRRREYPALFRQPQFAHLNIVILRSPRDMQRWLERLERMEHT